MKNSFIEGAISPEKIATSIAHHQHKTNIGGHSIFLGQVRADEIDQKVVKAIEFTTYRELAEQKIATIREDIFEKYALKIDGNKSLSKIQSVFYTDSDGNTTEAYAWIDDKMEVLKLQQNENLANGKKNGTHLLFLEWTQNNESSNQLSL